MGARRRMKDRYRRFSYLTDIGGIKSAIGEMKGKGFPKQPRLHTDDALRTDDPVLDEAWFVKTIQDKLARHSGNCFEYPFYGEPIFDEPLVGFVRGDDSLLAEYKNIIGPHHFTPEEIMAWQADNNGVPAPRAADLSVVSFVMPITRRTKDDNAARSDWVSERWAQTRLIGEIFSQTFVREIVTYLMGRGVLAISPDVTPMFNKKRYPAVGWASPWSHRHMAYAAGLGTFGMHDFLITEKGCAHRVGSFVVNLKLSPNRKRPADIYANCLQYQGIDCLKCKSRCPVDAITKENAHDKEKCYQRVAASTRYCNKNYHIFIYGCGLCATGTPCESGIPQALRTNHSSTRPTGKGNIQ
jgi:epoxyqueuosine reductase